MTEKFEKLTYITNKPVTHDSINKTSSINTPYHLVDNSLSHLSFADLKAMVEFLYTGHENAETTEKIYQLHQEMKNRIELL